MKRNILIIEDDESNRRILEMALRAMQCEVATAVNGEEGLVKARQKPPDLIIMDVMMPKMNGLQTLEALRQTAGLERTPVIVISAKASAQDERRAVDAGANHFLTKPFRVKDVQNVVAGFLDMDKVQP